MSVQLKHAFWVTLFFNLLFIALLCYTYHCSTVLDLQILTLKAEKAALEVEFNLTPKP